MNEKRMHNLDNLCGWMALLAMLSALLGFIWDMFYQRDLAMTCYMIMLGATVATFVAVILAMIEGRKR